SKLGVGHDGHSTQTSTVLWSTSSSTSTIFPCSPSWMMAVMLSQSRLASFISGENAWAILIPHLATPIGTLTLTVGWPSSTTRTRKRFAFFPGSRSGAPSWSLASASLAASSFVILDRLHHLGCQLRRPSVRGDRMGSLRAVDPGFVLLQATVSCSYSGGSLGLDSRSDGGCLARLVGSAGCPPGGGVLCFAWGFCPPRPGLGEGRGG